MHHVRLASTSDLQGQKYTYRIERRGGQVLYTVSDGRQSLTLSIRWVMGASFGIGQTYILEKDGQLYQSRVSYYRELKRLDLTLGAEGTVPASLNAAAGRMMDLDEKLKCFGCHATHATEGSRLTLARYDARGAMRALSRGGREAR